MTPAPSVKLEDESSAKGQSYPKPPRRLADLAVDFLLYFVVAPALACVWVIASLTGSVRGIAVAILIGLIILGLYFLAT